MDTKFSLFFDMIIISIFASITTTFTLLLEYIVSYHAPIIFNYGIIIPLGYFVFLLTVPLTVSMLSNSEKAVKIIFKITAIFFAVLLISGFFAKWQYSPQRIFLRQFNLGGRVESITFRKKQCDISGTPKHAYLIYKGNHFFYYDIHNSVEGINKDCLLNRMY